MISTPTTGGTDDKFSFVENMLGTDLHRIGEYVAFYHLVEHEESDRAFIRVLAVCLERFYVELNKLV